MSEWEDVQRRREVVQAFKRRRARALAALLLLCAAGFVGYMVYDDSEFHVAGLTGGRLLLAALAVAAASLVFYFVSWRCPACQLPFLGGLSVPLCPRCGAVFTDVREHPGVAPEVERREQAERALAAQVGRYKNKHALHLMHGLVIAGLGLLWNALTAKPGDIKEGWLMDAFGPTGAYTAFQVIGWLITLGGVALMAFSLHRATVGARRYAEQVRRFLEIDEGRG